MKDPEKETSQSQKQKKLIIPGPFSGLNLDINIIFEALVENSPLSIIITDLQGTMIYVSKAAILHAGYSRSEELIGKSAFLFIDPKDHDRARENLAKTLREGIKGDMEYTLVRKDGTHYAGELIASLLRDVQGKPVAFLGILRDKSDIQESKEQFQFLLQNVPAGVGISSADGKILLANDRMYQIFGTLPGGISRLNVVDYYVNPEERKKMLQLVRDKGGVLNFEAEMRRASGEKFWASLSLKILEFSGKKTFITTIIEITDRKNAEAALQELYQETVKISEMKTHIITYASHELKTPLIPIIGWADLMLSAKRKGQDLNKAIDTEDLESILRNAKRLQRIIDDFLDVGRIQSDRLKLDYEIVKLKDITNSAVRSLAQIAGARQISINQEVEDITINVDSFRIEQVLVNLLSNAIKYSEPQKHVWIRSQSSETETVITVEDEGFGFSPEELEDALQPFSSSFIHGKGEQMFSGTGVGLYISKGIVEQHGGTLQITSAGKDKGTKVAIYLPRNFPELNKKS